MSTKKFVLTSSDGESFEVDKAVARHFMVIPDTIEDDGVTEAMELPRVKSKILSKLIEYLTKHDGSKSEDELKDWDAEFMKVDRDTLFGLMETADQWGLGNLLELVCETAAKMIDEKSVEEIRIMFNVKSNYTPEEEAKLREENKWAFE